MATTKPIPKWKGLTDGVTSEWTLIAKIKPGQEGAAREFSKAIQERDPRTTKEVVIPVGTVHDYRVVLLDNDTRIMFMSNFDGDWGAYIDDFFATKVTEEAFDNLGSLCEGFPGKSASVDAKKEWFQANTQQATVYTRAYRGTVKEIWKALEVQKAFQQVLDTPGAEKALANPVLKPLLDLAAK